MEFKSTRNKISTLMGTLDASYVNNNDENVSVEEPPYQVDELSFFEKLKPKESNLPANAHKENRNTEAISRLDEKMDDELNLILSDDSDVWSDISLQVHVSFGDIEDVDNFSDHSDASPQIKASDGGVNKVDDFARLETDGKEEKEIAKSPVFSSRRGRRPRRRTTKTSNFSIDPASLPIARVVLQRLPQSLLQFKSITVAEDCVILDALDGSPDYIIHLCRTCQKMYVTRKIVSIPKKCFTCKTSLVYLCTKCHEYYYVVYDDMVYHWQYCKNQELGRAKIETMDSIEYLEEDEVNEENDYQLSVKETKIPKIAIPRLPILKIVLERLPESMIKLKHKIKNEDLSGVTQIKPKASSFNRDSIQRYCPKCKKKTFDHTDIRRPSTCKKCSRLLQYVCTSCNEEYFFNYFNLREHMKLCIDPGEWEHLSIVLYGCLVCDFKTQRRFSMVSHLETTRHSSDLEGTIQVAEAYNKSIFVREQHKIGLSKRIKLYCPKCQTFVPSIRNEKHCRKCNSLFLYHCIKCGQKKNDRRAMRHHLWTKCNPSRYQCVLCDYVSGGWYQMQSHLNSRHISGQFQCDQCTFRAKRKNYLKSHIMDCHSEAELVEEFYESSFDPSHPWRMSDCF